MILWSFVFEKLLIHLRSFFFKQLFEKWAVIKIRIIKIKNEKNKDKGDAREKNKNKKTNRDVRENW